MSEQPATCAICGEPMPPGEEMFKFHGFSGSCPKPPLPRPPSEAEARIAELEAGLREVLGGFPAITDDYPGRPYPGPWRLSGHLAVARLQTLRALLPPEAKGER